WERGVVTTYAYTQGLLTEVTYSGETNGHLTPNLAYQYDAFGRIIEVMRNGQRHASYRHRGNHLLLETENVNQDVAGAKVKQSYEPEVRGLLMIPNWSDEVGGKKLTSSATRFFLGFFADFLGW
ncbi:MAG: hypothetical protein ABF332_01615, partial [Akkermansiaceae bacterium]